MAAGRHGIIKYYNIAKQLVQKMNKTFHAIGDSHIIVTYPPKEACQRIRDAERFIFQ